MIGDVLGAVYAVGWALAVWIVVLSAAGTVAVLGAMGIVTWVWCAVRRT